MGLFERPLPVWAALCIVAGVGMGIAAPGLFGAIADIEYASVNLAVAVAISLFGLHSGAALATVVGVLVELPVMLSLVAVANRTRHRFEGFATRPDSRKLRR